MEEAEASTNPKPMAKEPAFCEGCKNHPSKYKCPGCSLHSCSLPCVKAHKQRTGCNGKRNMTKFVPLSEFDDNLLVSGALFLKSVFLSFITMHCWTLLSAGIEVPYWNLMVLVIMGFTFSGRARHFRGSICLDWNLVAISPPHSSHFQDDYFLQCDYKFVK
ncbi:hypothetical protein SLEP1_g39729 [Rubroshorea leprosula]|uniref:Box C/D snoRNA protein 1 n=1 Tax=Rubroshorea leprosula TaxID=152421 RepID=A0AAV5L156_9ROSI|nr:hypothetical protein SLEP1_g39729 [Rubroshorea leprosula]